MGFWSKKTQEEKTVEERAIAQKKFARLAAREFSVENWADGAGFLIAAVHDDKNRRENNVQSHISRATISFEVLEKTNREKGHYRRYILGRLPAEDLADMCRQGLVPWALALESKAAAPASDIADFMDKGAGNFDGKMLNAALRRAVVYYGVSQHIGGHAYDAYYETYGFGNAPANAATLIANGARTDGANADLLLRAVDQKNPELVRALVDGGANLMEAGVKALRRAEEMKDEKADIIAQYLKAKLERSTKNARVDDQTLVVTKKLDAMGSQLKLVFNFEAQRVTEIFTTYAAGDRAPQAAMISHRFEDYDAQTLKSAFDDLTALGGHPRPLPETIADKHVRPHAYIPRK